MAVQKVTKLVSKWIRGTEHEADEKFDFLENFSVEDDPLNGLSFNSLYIPEEVMLIIFSNLSPADILRCSLVCKNWYNIAKSNALWHAIYNKLESPKKSKNLPWYVYYCYFATNNFKNLLKNTCGEEQFKYWKILLNGGNQFAVEPTPHGAMEQPKNEPDFQGKTSCFVTSYEDCAKYQRVDLKPKRLLRHIIKEYRPTIYASEWITGRFDCGCVYTLTVACDTTENRIVEEEDEISRSFMPAVRRRRMPVPKYSKSIEDRIEQWAAAPWKKLEIKYDDYPDVQAVRFYHLGKDTQFWAGHYGSKMAGGVLRFDFDSIEPIINQ